MKKNFTIGLITIVSLTSAITLGITVFASSGNIINHQNTTTTITETTQKTANNIPTETKLSIDQALKSFLITIKEDPAKSYNITKEDAIDVANNFVSSYVQKEATNIIAQYNLLTDNGTSINALPKNVIEADPILNSRQKIEDIPAWIISYEGIAVGGHSCFMTINKNTNTSNQNHIYGRMIVIVDALSGKILSSLNISY